MSSPFSTGLSNRWFTSTNSARLAIVGCRNSSFGVIDRPSLEQWDEQLQCARELKANVVADLSSLRISQNVERNGYEFAGEVAGLGPGVADFELGEMFDL